MSSAITDFVLKFKSPNRLGITAAVANFLAERRFNIQSSDQFQGGDDDGFFMRMTFNKTEGNGSLEALQREFEPLAKAFDMNWSLRDSQTPRRVLIMVSKFDHCLVDLLYRRRIGELPMTVAAVVSNHPQSIFSELDIQDMPFFHLPVTPETKQTQEQQLMQIIDDSGAELIVLARYMQILSNELSSFLSKRCINIHHSFLPGFKGAKPYHQAHQRGVKLVGATAHYVTEDLDEGPIIEQDVERISHADTPESLIRKGRDIERRVLARGVRYHIEDRVLLDGPRCVVFPD